MAKIDSILDIVLFLFIGNRKFFKLIDEFHDKLPPTNKKGTKSTHPKFHYTVINTSTMQLNITKEEIDLFHKKLENFKYGTIIFKRKSIISYSKNIQRLLIQNVNTEFTLAIIQQLFEDENFKHSKPYLMGKTISQFIGC